MVTVYNRECLYCGKTLQSWRSPYDATKCLCSYCENDLHRYSGKDMPKSRVPINRYESIGPNMILRLYSKQLEGAM